MLPDVIEPTIKYGMKENSPPAQDDSTKGSAEGFLFVSI